MATTTTTNTTNDDLHASYGSAPSPTGSSLQFATLRPTSDVSVASSSASPMDLDRSERTSPHSSYIVSGTEVGQEVVMGSKREEDIGRNEDGEGESGNTTPKEPPIVRILGINHVPEGEADIIAVNGYGNGNGAIQEEDEEEAGRTSGTTLSVKSPGPQRTEFHPLKTETHTPSPPPWEVIQPPTSTSEEYATKTRDEPKPYVLCLCLFIYTASVVSSVMLS